MDFSETREQEMFRTLVREFVIREVEPVVAKLDAEETFPAEIVKKIAELNLFGLTISEEYGGIGGDSIQLSITGEELSRGWAALGTIFLDHASLSISLRVSCVRLYHRKCQQSRQDAEHR